MDLLPQLPSTPSFESHTKLLIEASEAKIARIESQIRDLECLRARERGIVARLRAAIAPVHKLPAELLAEIFRYKCSSDWYGPYGSPIYSEAKKVQALTHVCVYWRQVAINTPRLWTNTLSIELEKTPTDAYAARLKEWVDRSAPLPIGVHLVCWPGADATAVLKVLLTAFHRWSGASFELPSLSLLSRVPPEALQHLQRLQLQSRQDTNSGSLSTFSRAHNLRGLSLDIRRAARLSIPWSNLLDLNMTADTPEEALHALLQCTNIVSASFHIPAWTDLPDLSEIKLTTLGRLETLDITFDAQQGFVVPFFVCLALPALKRLVLHLDSELSWSSAEFTQFQLRSPNIDNLSISWCSIDSDDLMAILRHAPLLSELLLEGCADAFDDIVVEALCFSPQDPVPLVPHLHEILVWHGCEAFEDDTVDALIASRWWTDEQLAAFPSPPKVSRWSRIEICREDSRNDNLEPEFEAKLEEYRAQGLRVAIDVS
ncbi:hypothetical protein B0H16DRAFT_1894741 [Mycena metata]|uniref:F-box domain-containing protein n=1 Tax=Mycena metata TaxID=1033252 RepID=A0AAD7MPQ9_9AGAR|nr:hypothetical protein B0H16DRAFT_1894741 [Mycena metata]